MCSRAGRPRVRFECRSPEIGCPSQFQPAVPRLQDRLPESRRVVRREDVIRTVVANGLGFRVGEERAEVRVGADVLAGPR